MKYETLAPQIQAIIKASADVYGITPYQLMQRSRRRRILDARNNAIHRISELNKNLRHPNKLSLKEIGRMFNRHHSTIIHTCRVVDDLIETDDVYRKLYEQLHAKTFNVTLTNKRQRDLYEIVSSLQKEHKDKVLYFISDLTGESIQNLQLN